MSTAGKPVRPWQEIAEETFGEKDPKRLPELVEELCRATDEELKQEHARQPTHGRRTSEV